MGNRPTTTHDATDGKPIRRFLEAKRNENSDFMPLNVALSFDGKVTSVIKNISAVGTSTQASCSTEAI